MALSGGQRTRNAPGGAGRVYAGFTAKAATVVVATKSGASRLTSIEAQRAADRQKKRRVTYAVDALKEDIRQAVTPTAEPAKAEARQARPVPPKAPESIKELRDPIADTLAAIEKSIQRRKKKDAARAASVLKIESKRLAEEQRLTEAEAKRKTEAEAKRLAEIEDERARVKAEAAKEAQATASAAVAEVLSATIQPLSEIRKKVRAQVRASISETEDIDAAEIKAITDKAMEVVTTEDLLVLAMLEMEKRHKKAVMKMAMFLS